MISLAEMTAKLFSDAIVAGIS
ncbi:hypothetical protein FJ419_00540 [Mesorhizobium sp. B2-6-2]|nr:hypothetical protein FJ419_00540 [Mesorhizobium sp. B2-6-2]